MPCNLRANLRPRRLLLLGAATFIVSTTLSCGGNEPEAVYQGRPASEWIASLADADPATRLQGVEAVEALGPGARPAIPNLLALLDGSDTDLRRGAVRALTAVGEPSDEVVAAFVELLGDEELALWHRENDEWWGDLKRARGIRGAFSDDEIGYCSMTAKGLVIMQAEGAIEPLGRVGREGDRPNPALCAVDALASLGSMGDRGTVNRAIDALAPILLHPNATVSDGARQGLSNIVRHRSQQELDDAAETAERVVAVVWGDFDNEDPTDVAGSRVRTLGSIANLNLGAEVNRKVAEHLAEGLEHRDAAVALEAIRQLSQLGRGDGAPVVVDVALDELIAVLERSDDDFLEHYDRDTGDYWDTPEKWAAEPLRALRSQVAHQMEVLRLLTSLGPSAAAALPAVDRWAGWDADCASAPRGYVSDPASSLRGMRCNSLPQLAKEAAASLRGA